jgi:D-sedoheptulose 7-phosphate isomerase
LTETSPARTLAAYADALHAALASARFTDGSGRALDVETWLDRAAGLLRVLRERHGCLYVIGNGGSAAVAAHTVTDFLHLGRLRATTIHDASLLTCMTNDYGYEEAYARILSRWTCPGDALVAISSSGRSANIRNAAAAVRALGGTVITLSGFAADNPLRALGDLNGWLDAGDYGLVEIGHQLVLHVLASRLQPADERR